MDARPKEHNRCYTVPEDDETILPIKRPLQPPE
jgi:hypothetical protein